MKKIIMTALLTVMACGGYATDFSTLPALTATDIKASGTGVNLPEAKASKGVFNAQDITVNVVFRANDDKEREFEAIDVANNIAVSGQITRWERDVTHTFAISDGASSEVIKADTSIFEYERLLRGSPADSSMGVTRIGKYYDFSGHIREGGENRYYKFSMKKTGDGVYEIKEVGAELTITRQGITGTVSTFFLPKKGIGMIAAMVSILNGMYAK